MSKKGGVTSEIPKHRILREVYRHYLEYRQFVSDTGQHVIEHGYFLYDEDGNHQINADGTKRKVSIAISFWDLFEGLKDLSPRKREAVWYNVILDQKQHVVAKQMNITTVSVGQYVEQAMLQLSERYFAEEKPSEEESKPDSSNQTSALSEVSNSIEQNPFDPKTNGRGSKKNNLGNTARSIRRKEKALQANVAK